MRIELSQGCYACLCSTSPSKDIWVVVKIVVPFWVSINPFPLILKRSPSLPNIKTDFRGVGFYIRGGFGSSGYESD